MRMIRPARLSRWIVLSLSLLAPCVGAQTADIQAIVSSMSPAQAAEARAMAGSMSPQDIQRALKQAGEQKPASPPPAEPGEKVQGDGVAKTDPLAKENLIGFASRTALRPFGERLMAGGDSTARTLDIPAPSDYRIGPGDTVLLQLFGKDNRSYSLPITRDGFIQIPEIGPLVVAGMTFEEMSALVIDRITKQKIGVEASITMGPLRSIQVFLVGDVRNPGAYTVPALTTVTNALLAAGGVRQSGSLRRIELRRNHRLASRLDIYDVLLKGDVRADVRLLPGDVIFVPPAGTRVGIEGEVNRPAIFELLAEKTAEDVLRLAGGLLPTAFADGAKLYRALPDDARSVSQAPLGNGKGEQLRLRDGDVLFVPPSVEALRGSVELVGAVQRPGAYQWQSGTRLGDLLYSPHLLKKDVWRLLGLVEHTDADSGAATIETFSLRSLKDMQNVALRAGDRVFFLSEKDADFLASAAVQSALRGESAGSCQAVSDLAMIVKSEGGARFRSAILHEGGMTGGTRPCPPLFQEHSRLLPIALEHAAVLRGEVKHPGFVLVAPGLSIMDVVETQGGLTRAADPGQIEISRSVLQGDRVVTDRKVTQWASAGRETIEPGDMIVIRKRFNQMDSGVVRVSGEVRHPGAFDIRRGERLSELLTRAGGLTENAYAYGAVFQRQRVKEQKREYYARAGIEMQNAILMMTARQKRTTAGGADAATFAAMGSLANEIKKIEPSGRVVVEADPAVLQVHPELDVVLEPGDEVVIPKRPGHVVVMGEVLNPGAVQFKSGLRADDYLRAAGGVAQTGDEQRTYMILPNGSAEPLKVASWNAQPTPVPPGSVIYVPRDPLPLDNTALFQTVLEIAKDVALTAASLYSITK